MDTNPVPRIIVVVAQVVQTRYHGDVKQICGRAMAQACHAVGKLRYNMLLKQTRNDEDADFLSEAEPFTTIILAARDTAEMRHIVLLASGKLSDRNWVVFHDTNEAVYGEGEHLTSIAFEPGLNLTGITDYLPLFGPITSTSQIMNVASKIDLVPVSGQSVQLLSRIPGVGIQHIVYVAPDFDDTLEFGV